MTPKETEAIYTEACRAKRIAPQAEEGRMWHKALKDYEARDVRTALDAWWASTDRDSKGDLKSQWMPAPGELIAFVERAKHKREAAAAIPRFLTCWECPPCRYRCTGFYPKGSDYIATCPHCGKPMAVFHRERGAA